MIDHLADRRQKIEDRENKREREKERKRSGSRLDDYVGHSGFVVEWHTTGPLKTLPRLSTSILFCYIISFFLITQ